LAVRTQLLRYTVRSIGITVVGDCSFKIIKQSDRLDRCQAVATSQSATTHAVSLLEET
jgi:hypothetical protein